MDKIFYDCEIINCIPIPIDLPGITYCKGWGDYKGMGISVIGHQFNDQEPSFSLTVTDFDDFLLSPGHQDAAIIGFNSLSFDDRLLMANGLKCSAFTDYDLLHQIRIAAGYKANSRPAGRSYSLGSVAEANGLAKNGDGALAPVLWQEGHRREVIDYCLNDVSLTARIFNLGQKGKLIDPNTGEPLQLASLEEVMHRV